MANKHPNFQLAAFITALARGRKALPGILAERLNPGGWDYYRPVRDRLRDISNELYDPAFARTELQKLNWEPHRENNVRIHDLFFEWLSAKGGRLASPLTFSKFDSPRNLFSVYIKPDVTVELKGMIHPIVLWCIKGERLPHHAAQIGCQLMRKQVATDSKRPASQIKMAVLNVRGYSIDFEEDGYVPIPSLDEYVQRFEDTWIKIANLEQSDTLSGSDREIGEHDPTPPRS